MESSFEVAGSSQVQNVTFLGNVFVMSFFTALGLRGLGQVIERGLPKPRLASEPQCGQTTGGRDECWWDCEFQLYEEPTPGLYVDYITDLDCLTDCYSPPHCLNSLLEDYRTAGGVCQNSWLDINFPGVFSTSSSACQFHEPDDFYWFTDIKTGLCSQRTQELIQDYENCGRLLLARKFTITRVSNDLIYSLCDFDTWVDFIKPPPDSIRVKPSNFGKKKRKNRKKKNKSVKKNRNKSKWRKKDGDDERLIPIEDVEVVMFSGFNITITSVPPLENTRHRYPWVCSLRTVGQQSSHQCGVTLLARPPGPTVLVTSAHCTFLCKSEEGNIVPNCCCPNVGPDICSDNPLCGRNAGTVEMTGADVEVLCGEWDTATDTQEEYNVVLPIEKITRHPDFEIFRGEQNSQYVANDIAVIHTRDEKFESLSRTHDIYPACLPSTSVLNSSTAVHSGWSTAPPLDFVASQVPQYLQVYKYFHQQWHFNMNISQCRDPVRDFWTQAPLNFPTNSYYPPGTVCATEMNGEFCPTSGESGSPLMLTDQKSRFVAEGLLSFIKGCSDFDFREVRNRQLSVLNQLSENPVVYTKLSCYLPWIAAQYNMEFSPDGESEQDCLTGQGHITPVTADVCRTNPFMSTWDRRDGIEAACLFPFTLNGETHSKCIMDQIEDFTRPVFRCPIRAVKGAGPAGTDYTDHHLIGGDSLDGFACPTNAIGVLGLTVAGQVVYEWNDEGPVIGPNGEFELDPGNDLCLATRPIFATCKNNCPGVNFPVVSGGFALLFATGAAAGGLASRIIPVVGAGLGILGVGGAAMMMTSQCAGPILCAAPTGQCCLLLINNGRAVCPASC